MSLYWYLVRHLIHFHYERLVCVTLDDWKGVYVAVRCLCRALVRYLKTAEALWTSGKVFQYTTAEVSYLMEMKKLGMVSNALYDVF